MSVDPANGSSSSDLPFLVTHWLSNYNQQQNAHVATASTSRNGTSKSSSETNGGKEEAKSNQEDAMERIRNATADLAAAFSDLGVFGLALNTPIPSGAMNPNADLRNAKYGDVLRRWNGLSGKHLEALVGSSSNATAAILNDAKGKSSVLDLAYDRERGVGIGAGAGTGTGTGPGDAVNSQSLQQQDILVPSMLQKPIQLLRSNVLSAEGTSDSNSNTSTDSIDNLTQQPKNHVPSPVQAKLTIGSDIKRIECLAAQASKRYLAIRAKFQEEERTIRQIQKSLTYQNQIKADLEVETTALLSTHCASVGSASAVIDIDAQNDRMKITTSDSLAQNKLENDRVVEHLGRRILEVQNTHTTMTQNEMEMASSVTKTLWKENVTVGTSYTDPMRSRTFNSGFHSSVKLHGQKINSIVNHVIARGYGVGMKQRKGSLRRRIGMCTSQSSIRQRNKKLLIRRLSHVVTINSHLFCPVYCLRFDQTGRYFVTGADDNLVKLFRIGSTANTDCRERQKYNSKNPEFSHQRGAVLVCTLRGHASVITDIDVSVDNALLATASEDGDVRIWGMTDGCPVAILRGHDGGANMVAWSKMTPFQLVSVAGDGLARTWDVREAALKRCKAIRDRSDFVLPLEEKKDDADNGIIMEQQGVNLSDEVVLPPLPTTIAQHEENQNEGSTEQHQDNGDVFVPPLPPGAENGIGAEAAANNSIRGNGGADGAFIANDEIDEGVSLLLRHQHGELPEQSQFGGAGTRSRRKKVKVLCISRCPIGGQFATGSDDGIGRIWSEDSNKAIEKMDMINSIPGTFSRPINCVESQQTTESLQRTRSTSLGNSNAPSTRSLLASLHGHHNEITDIQYSSLGDRLITASQKDGVVRVWSWGNETPKGLDGLSKIDQIKQIFIRLEPPQHLQQRANISNQRTGSSNRRRGNMSSSQSPSLYTQCDIAAWTADDSKIITSQSCVVKQADNEIIAGSHLLYVWDSLSGNCLVGIPGAHEKPCPVLSSHPLDSSIIVSAGADGRVKLWDLDSGKCVFSHRNKHEYGALENLADRGKACGYLDGSFSPDGLHLVLTDDTGRITIFDILSSEELAEEKRMSSHQRTNRIFDSMAPTWMQEQYFANDYYDLFYDASGYCIERGSRLPPHIAPEAARCMHTGHAYADSIQLAFVGIGGPMPTLESVVSSNRDSIRRESQFIRKQGGILAHNIIGKRNLIEARATGASHIGKTSDKERRAQQASTMRRPVQRTETARSAQSRNMSDRYRWIGFEEMERENNDEDEVDTDDEEYQEGNRLREDGVVDDYLPGRRNQNSAQRSRPAPSRRRNQNSTQRSRRRENRNHARRDIDELEEVIQNEPTRVSARQFNRKTEDQYIYDSDESEFEEMLSSNTSPTGQYKEDYTELGHLYKLPSGGSVNREWVKREYSVLGYTGWKTYSPQEGDKVVYIPKPHSDTLRTYPVCETTTGAPWKSWPRSYSWSVVVCEVKNIRYRFPYSGYYGSRARNPLRSVVAILTLELTDIPRVSHDRSMPWAKPEFVPISSTRSRTSTFEVSIFENGESDFIIPLQLYTWRIQSLEKAIAEKGLSSKVDLTDFYVNTETEDSRFDPFSCQLLSTVTNDQQELHFQESGYNSLHIQYEGSDNNLANSWDVTINGTEKDCPLPPCLTDDQEKAVIDTLDALESDFYVKATFSAPVNERSFVDYSMMIEVPMDISIIRRRLRNKYYTNARSVYADMRLIRDNCFKYNKMGSEITNEVKKLFDSFTSLLEERLIGIGREPGERQGDKEIDAVVKTISKFPSSRSRTSETSNGDTANVAIQIGRNQSSLRTSGRNRRNERGAAEIPRIRIMRRRQQEYISEEDSDSNHQQEYMSEEDSDSEVENGSIAEEGEESDIVVPNLKVVVSGEEYHISSSSEDDSGNGEQTDSLRHKRRTINQRKDSNCGENIQTTREIPSRRSKRNNKGESCLSIIDPVSSHNKRRTRSSSKIDHMESTDGDDRSMSVDEHATIAPRGRRSQSTRTVVQRIENVGTDSEDDFNNESSEEEEETAAAIPRNLRSRRSARMSGTKEAIGPSKSCSEDEMSASEEVMAPSIRGRRSTRMSILSNTKQSNNVTTSTSEDELINDNPISEEEEPHGVVPTRRSTRLSRTTMASFEHEASDAEEDHKPIISRSRRSRRSTRTPMTSSEDELSEQEEEIIPNVSHRRTSRSKQSTRTPVTFAQTQLGGGNRSSPRRGRAKVQSLQEAFTRRISARAAPSRSRRAQRSVLESEETRRGGRLVPRSAGVGSSALEQLPPSSPGATRFSSRDRANVPTYHDLSNSDFEQEESDEEQHQNSPEVKRKTRKRLRTSPGKQVVSQRIAKKQRRVMEINYPELDKWPGHMVKQDMMYDLCIAILERVETFDAERLFHSPVIEQVPDIAESYLDKIEMPMDLRTIRTERITTYRVISELQDDLILIFQNCCTFNKKRSTYWKYAFEIWENLNDIFVQTLNAKNIDLPRRFGR